MKEKRKGGSDQVALETRSETARYSESRGGDIYESASGPARGLTPFLRPRPCAEAVERPTPARLGAVGSNPTRASFQFES